MTTPWEASGFKIDQVCVTCGEAAFRHHIYASLGGVLIETDLYECVTPDCPGPVAVCEPIDGWSQRDPPAEP
ncbi:hypothetical protein R3Q17_25565 [Rhodococcus opacus]|nr:hypothetical protein [Rhodococcus opacus]